MQNPIMAIWVMNIKLNLVDMLKCMDICSLYQKEILKNIFYYVIDISINIAGVYAFWRNEVMQIIP